MAFTDWSPKSAYYQIQNKDKSSGCFGCNEEHPCEDCKGDKDKCGCCAPGLVEIRDPSDDSKIIACLTPNDAEGYYLTVAPPPTGYVRWVNAGVFMGFITVADYQALNP